MFNYLFKKGPRRGVQTLEFLVAALGIVGSFLSALTDSINAGDALTSATILAAVLIAARGAAKLGGAPELEQPMTQNPPTTLRGSP